MPYKSVVAWAFGEDVMAAAVMAGRRPCLLFALDYIANHCNERVFQKLARMAG